MRVSGRYGLLGIAVGVFLIVGMVLSTLFSLTMPVWLPFICFVLAGIGYSRMFSVTLIAMIAAIDHEYQVGTASA